MGEEKQVEPGLLPPIYCRGFINANALRLLLSMTGISLIKGDGE